MWTYNVAVTSLQLREGHAEESVLLLAVVSDNRKPRMNHYFMFVDLVSEWQAVAHAEDSKKSTAMQSRPQCFNPLGSRAGCPVCEPDHRGGHAHVIFELLDHGYFRILRQT